MDGERNRRKLLIVTCFMYIVWALAISGVIALVEGGEVSALAIGMVLLAILVAAAGFYIGRALMRLPLPSGYPAKVFGQFLYTVYVGMALVLLTSSLPLLLDIPELALYPGYSIAKVAGAGAMLLGLAILTTFVMWHRAYLQEIKSLSA